MQFIAKFYRFKGLPPGRVPGPKKTTKIAKKVGQCLIALLLLALVFPRQQLPAAQAKLLTQAPALLAQTVKVVDTVLTTAVSVVAQDGPLTGCAFGQVTGNLVEQADIINLNQPASCFSLSQTRAAPAYSLKVVAQPMALAPVKINVIPSMPAVSGPSFFPGPVSQSASVLLVSLLGAEMAYETWKRKTYKNKFLPRLTGRSVPLGLDKLMMLRC